MNLGSLSEFQASLGFKNKIKQTHEKKKEEKGLLRVSYSTD